MSLYHRFRSYFKIRITSAEPMKLLSFLADKGIVLQEVRSIGLLTLEIQVHRKYGRELLRILEKYGANYKIIEKTGYLRVLTAAKKRPVLIVGTCLLLFLALSLPGRILFTRVEGNVQIPDKLILSQAEECGVRFGSSSRDVRSEKVKNQLLARIPQLQWVGVNTSGCVATIHVEERSELKAKDSTEGSVSSLIALRDGVISEMTVYRGSPLCQIGQKVSAGDVLVSGYTDCGLKVQAENARGEIFAHTLRQQLCMAPTVSLNKGAEMGNHTCYRLKIGKKEINLCNHSGIHDVTCDKMYREEFLTLPGDFRLPVSLIREVYSFRSQVPLEADSQTETPKWLEMFAQDYLCSQMIAGEIISKEQVFFQNGDCYLLVGQYACNEMIGQVKYEETLE